MNIKTNHLSSSLSPYLLQHQHNPVDWYPWSDEALNRAFKEDKPIFLSIGYSACHWCHVMEKESFENQTIAQILNEHFISIKVDREERPDLDRLYMTSVQAMTGRGGWPMTVFLTPHLKPFIAGTYFPPTSRHGMTGFQELLLEIVRLWESDRATLLRSSEKVFKFLCEDQNLQKQWRGLLSDNLLEQLSIDCQKNYDSEWGGFGRPPKFPQVGMLLALLRQLYRQSNPKIYKILAYTLEQMARGGIHDQIGGGFHRYSVDEMWLVPHFEKMLYDNALISRLYLEAYQLTKEGSFLDIALNTLDYLLREMQDPLGGFYSALDADSEGTEGKFYIWSFSEIVMSLADPDLFLKVYGITEDGNFEGDNILHQAIPIWSLSQEEQEKLARERSTLLKIRNERIHPHLDDKILVDWNALTITSLAKAYQITRQNSYLEAAKKAAYFIEKNLLEGDDLHHVWRKNLGSGAGFLEDYANFSLALIDLYECDFDLHWLQLSKTLADHMISLFWDSEDAAFYSTSSKHTHLLVRHKNFQDDATLSGNAQAAVLLLKLSSLFDSLDYLQKAESTLSAHALAIPKATRWYGSLLCSIDHLFSSNQEIVLMGSIQSKKTQEYLQTIQGEYLPHRVVALCSKEQEPIPLCKGKNSKEGDVFICYKKTCYPPLSDVHALSSLLKKRN